VKRALPRRRARVRPAGEGRVWHRIAFFAAVLAIGCGGDPRSFRELLEQVEGLPPAERGPAIQRYITTKGGTPLIEQQSRLVLLAQDVNGATPRIVGDFNKWAATPAGHDASVGKPTRIEGTDWSYLETSAFTNARVEYVLLFEKEARPDPLNPRSVSTYSGPHSEVRMPLWIAQPEIDQREPAPAGTIVQETIVSRMLGASRRVWFYTPPGYEGSESWFPVVYVLDGGAYVERLGMPQILDRLIARKAIPPAIAVFVEPGERLEEYSRNARWRAFVATELVPFVDKRFRTFPAPEQRLIFGSSLSAYGAVDLAVEYQAIFGLCAALAPPVQTATVITNQPKGKDAIRGVRFFVMAGTYDSIADGGRRLRTALDIGTGSVTYLEVPEGHSPETFRNHIDDALKALLPQPAS
jgi:enterochelin esterase-like enzyme